MHDELFLEYGLSGAIAYLIVKELINIIQQKKNGGDDLNSLRKEMKAVIDMHRDTKVKEFLQIEQEEHRRIIERLDKIEILLNRLIDRYIR